MPCHAHDLPPFRVGPYKMRIVPATRDMFKDKRRIVEPDWTAGTVLIKKNLSNRKVLECLVRSIVAAIHYRSGLDDRSSEESFTHSLATGLVELAQNSPEFWLQFNKLLEAEYSPRAGWGRAVAASPADRALSDPKIICFEGTGCKIEWIPAHQWTTPDAYGWYIYKDMHIELSDSLYGVNRALVALHEVFHFLHHCLGLKDNAKERDFKRAHACMLLQFIQQNPKFWAWWLSALRATFKEQKIAA